MPTIINNPPGSPNNDSSSAGLIIGLILIIAVLVLFFVYGLPALRNNASKGTTINVPDKVDVNVNKQPGY
jgi:hypothetical protein